MWLRPGDVFAGYRIVRRIGAGGMGAVYLAEHPRLPRLDALKVLDASLGTDAEFRARFEREAELAARLEHPNIVSIYDRGGEGDLLWISMRFVDGVDAGELVKAGPAVLPPRRALHIVSEAARGLDAAHRRGLLHRDVKPANILVSTGDDGSDTVRITDFGIARSVDASASLTVTGAVLATFAYAAPEQLTGGPLDHRADVYSLGCSLYEMLTGTVPFKHNSPGAALYAHLYQPPPRPSAAHPGLPAALDDVIVRAMAKHPADRFGSCGELAAAAYHAVNSPPAQPVPQQVSGEATRPPRVTGARVLAIGVTAVVLVAAIALAATLGFGSRNSAGSPTGTSTTSTATGTTAVPTTTTVPSAWGPASYIADAFPGLLPASPEGTGYQGMRCALNDDIGAWLHCPASDDAGINVNIRCNPSRQPRTYTLGGNGLSTVREEQWSRRSGSGSVRWASDALAGFGLLEVVFDDPHRAFCVVGAAGGSSGQDVFDRWWVGAPI